MNEEQRHLKQLRDRQLSDRDPLIKQRRFQSISSQKERRARAKRYTLREAWLTIPNVYRSPFIGLLLGLVILLILPLFWDSTWAYWVGLGFTLFFVLLGLFIGRAQDIRENLQDALKR